MKKAVHFIQARRPAVMAQNDAGTLIPCWKTGQWK